MEYKQFVAIKNVRTNRYFSIDNNNRPLSSGLHPFLKHPESNKNKEIFQILNVANQDYAGPITMQSAILIYNPDSCSYLCCLQNGEMKFEKLPPNEASYSKATKFMIYGRNSTSLKKPITENDEIVFKYNDTHYVISELSLQCSWNGPNISNDSSWKIQRSNTPPVPDWLTTRSIVSLNYLIASDSLTHCLTKKDERKPIGSHQYQVQSVYLIEDLLFAMMSIEGTYIKKKTGSFEYQIEAHLEQTTCDLSLQQMVSKILPMCTQHDQIEHYIFQKSKFEYGNVSQAFCSAIKELLQKYLLMVNQLDYEFTQGDLTLQKFWYYTQPSIRIIEALFKLTSCTQKQIGGQLLSTITDFLNTNTDPQIFEVYQFLWQKSFIPYMKQLAEWIYFGRIDDPFDEFIVQEKKIQKSSIENEYRDDYWDQRFTLRIQQIPKFLEKYSDIILRTGKYINVIGDLSPPFGNYLIEHQGHILETQDFSHIVQCFEWANKEIIQMLFKKEKILARLKCVKQFFLFDSGDFFVHFIDAAETELMKDIKDISKQKLESLFDLSIRAMAFNDIFKEEMICYIDQYTISEQVFAIRNLRGIDMTDNKPPRSQKMKGTDLFTIDMKVNWPANLILSRASLVNYQILFRSMFSLRYLEKQLNDAWLSQKSLKDTGLHFKFVKQCCLLQRMIHLIKNYLYYLSYDVIEKNYQQLLQKLQNADNFEEVKDLHMKFSEICLKESLLIDQEFGKIMNRCISSANQFSIQIQKQTQSLMNFFKEDSVARKEQIQEKILELVSESQFKILCDTFIKNFDEAHRDLIRLVKTYISQSKTYLICLMTRFDSQFII